MSKLAQYLQEHVRGEVTVSSDARQHFATDASIFTLMPSAVVYPHGEQDVRKVARFTWQLAERGRVVPITARGAGTDQSGAAIGSGVILAFPAHMNRILELDSKTGTVTVEPGIIYGKLQQALQTHGRFLPPFPASLEYSTIGGAVANNAAGEMSVKYGTTRDYVKSLRVVLANGEAIVTGRLNKRDFSKKLGLATFEGEIYRSLDALLEENHELVHQMSRRVTKNVAGYDLLDIKHKDGSFDLTPLFVGSQGTLGIVTEVTFRTEAYNPETTLIVAGFNTLQQLQQAIADLHSSRTRPSTMEIIDGNLLQLVESLNPSQLKDTIQSPYPAFMLFVEYDDSGRIQKKNTHAGMKILKKYAANVQAVTDLEDQDTLWRIRHAASIVATHGAGQAKALPVIEDGSVPIDQFGNFVQGIYEILALNHLQPAVWGHAGDAHLHVQPYLNLAELGDRQKIFRLMDEYYKMVIDLGGTITGEHGDGRLRGPYLAKMYGDEAYGLLEKVKRIFDPHGTLNPGVKIGATIDDIKSLLRHEYTLGHLYQHVPRS